MTEKFPHVSTWPSAQNSTAVRPLEDIEATGIIADYELQWLCKRVRQLESALMTIADMRVTRIAREALHE